MRHHPKLKAHGRVALRKSVATSATAIARRNFPAWIDAGEPAVTFTASRSATPRVRAGLVLRRVSRSKIFERSVPHGPTAR